MLPFTTTDPVLAEALRAIRLVATDVDGTLTTDGVLSPEVVAMIADLGRAGVDVMPVSGRAAGEVLGLVRYLPGVDRGIAENGQVLVEPDRTLTWLVPQSHQADIESRARAIARELGDAFDLAPDSFCRVGDVAFERAGREDASVARIASAAAARGLHVVWSSVHIHFSTVPPDKGRAVERVLDALGIPHTTVLAMGDAPNDAGLFVADRFRVSVGTHDVLGHVPHLAARPSYVCDEREGAAFASVARALLALK